MKLIDENVTRTNHQINKTKKIEENFRFPVKL